MAGGRERYSEGSTLGRGTEGRGERWRREMEEKEGTGGRKIGMARKQGED